MNKRPELSFDGKGINGPDIYRGRVATFTNDVSAAHYGHQFAAAPRLLAALKAAEKWAMLTQTENIPWLDEASAAISAATNNAPRT